MRTLPPSSSSGPTRWCRPRRCSHFAGERLADYKVPRQITFLAELPRNAGGKVVKSRLGASRSSGTESSGLSNT